MNGLGRVAAGAGHLPSLKVLKGIHRIRAFAAIPSRAFSLSMTLFSEEVIRLVSRFYRSGSLFEGEKRQELPLRPAMLQKNFALDDCVAIVTGGWGWQNPWSEQAWPPIASTSTRTQMNRSRRRRSLWLVLDLRSVSDAVNKFGEEEGRLDVSPRWESCLVRSAWTVLRRSSRM